MNKKQLQQMIEMLVESALMQEKDDESKPSGIDLSGDAGSDDSSSATDTDAGATDADATDSTVSDSTPDSGTNASDLSGDIDGLDSADGDTADTGSSGASSGAGGGFGVGSFSGGFDSGSSDDSSTDSDSTDLDDGSGNSDVVDDSMPLDPIQDTIDMAVSLSKEIGDHQIILNVIKSKMQKYFPDFDDAIPIIQGLWDTNDPNLKIVARKLIMFIKGD